MDQSTSNFKATTENTAAVPVFTASSICTESNLQGGIEILVDMAKKGEIDPKNIDIIDVTDRFLKAIAATPKENLWHSGKILFHASVLLRMKAEALFSYEPENYDDFLQFEDGPIIYDSQQNPVARQITLEDLEKALVRRSLNRQLHKRRVTLEELIEALHQAEKQEHIRHKKKVEPFPGFEDQAQINDVDDILELAHDEDIETIINKVEEILQRLLKSKELLSLKTLVEQLHGQGDWVDAFLSILFLSSAGKLTLCQEDFYGPLYVAPLEAQGLTFTVPATGLPNSRENYDFESKN